MALVKKTIELDQEQINRIKTALGVESEEEALNQIIGLFDTNLQLAEVTLGNAGTFNFDEGWSISGLPVAAAGGHDADAVSRLGLDFVFPADVLRFSVFGDEQIPAFFAGFATFESIGGEYSSFGKNGRVDGL